MNDKELLSIINRHVGYAEQEIYDAVAEYEEEKINFAKLHVEAALKAASNELRQASGTFNSDYRDQKISILNAYPLEKIK